MWNENVVFRYIGVGIVSVIAICSFVYWSWFIGFLAFGICLLFVSLNRSKLELPPFLLSGILFVSSASISAYLAVDRSLSWNSTCLKISYFLLWLVLWNVKSSKLWKSAAINSLLLISAYCIYQSASHIIAWYSGWRDVANEMYGFQPILYRIRGVWNYANELAVLCVVLLPLAFVGLRYAKTNLLKICFSLLSLLLLLVLLYTRTRSAWIALNCEVFCFAILFRTSKSFNVIGLSSVFIALLFSLFDDFHTSLPSTELRLLEFVAYLHTVTPFVVFIPFVFVLGLGVSRVFRNFQGFKLKSSVVFIVCLAFFGLLGGILGAESIGRYSIGEFNLNVTSGRGYIWGGALEAFKQHPWFGIGSGSFGRFWSMFNDSSVSFIAMHAHNTWLDVLAGQGILGFLGFVAILLELFFVFPYGNPALKGRMLLVLLSGCMAICTFDSIFTSPSNMVIVLMIFSFLIKADRAKRLKFTPGPIGIVALLVVVIPFEGAFRVQDGLGSFAAAEMYTASKTYDSAVVSYHAALEKRPNHPLFEKKLGLAFARQGDLDSAIYYLEKSSSHGVIDMVNLLNVSSLYLRNSDTVSFVRLLNDARKQSRGVFEPYISMIILRYGIDSSLSKAEFIAAKDRAPLFPYSMLCRGWSRCREFSDSDNVASTNSLQMPTYPILSFAYHSRKGQVVETKWVHRAVGYDLLGISDPLFNFYVNGAPYPVDLRVSATYLYGIESEGEFLFPEIENLLRVDWSSVHY